MTIDNNILFRKLIENSYSGITLLDRDLNIVYRSPSAERISGWTTANRVKNTIDELTHPADREYLKLLLQQVLKEPGISKTCSFRSRHFNGGYIWLECNYTNMLDEPGIEAIVSNFIDITDSKINEEKITESKDFIKTITDNLPAMISYWTADLHCLFANKAYYEWFDKEAREMTGVSKLELIGEEEFKQDESYFRAVLQGKPQSFERTFVKANGTTMYAQTQYLPDRDGDKVKGFYSLIYDVSETKVAQLEVNKKTEQIQELLDNINDGFISLDKDMYYTYANPQIGKILGLDPGSLIGKNIWEIFPDAVGSSTYEAIQTAFTEKRYVCNEDYYAPLDLWQENRVYPSENGISMFIRDISQQKKEEQHLKLLESVITNTTDAVLITEGEPFDEPGPRIIYVNEAFTKMTGYTSEEVIGKPPRILQGPGSDRHELDRLRIALDKCVHCEITIINYKKNGEEFYINMLVSPVFDDQGKCTHFIAIERDVTHQKNEELQKIMLAKAITESLKERNTILESIGDAFFALDKNWIITYWNNMAEKVMGKSRSEVLNKNIWEIYPEAVNSSAYAKYQEALETRKAVHFELYTMYLKSWADISIYPTENGLSVYVRDVNERKKAELTATAALAEKNTILESIGDAFFAVDKNWLVTYWNNMAEKVLLVSKNDILNHCLWDVFKDSIGSVSYKKYHEAVETNQAIHFEDHYEPLNKWYEISAYPTGNGLSVYFKDITDRKNSDVVLADLSAALQKHAKELAISNADLEQFAYVASHDLQEPLRMITGFLTQFERKYGDIVDDKGKQYIHFAVDGAKRMRQIILDLLEFSRVGRMDNSEEKVDIDKLITDILVLYRKLIVEKKAIIRFNNMPILLAYKVQLRQVFQNLIGNSLKYQAQGHIPEITIKHKETSKHHQFAVHDNGIGIDPEYFDKIFIIFQRLHNKDEYSGTGMGLAITKKIVESLGGKIWLESEEGKGTTFYFTILKSNI